MIRHKMQYNSYFIALVYRLISKRIWTKQEKKTVGGGKAIGPHSITMNINYFALFSHCQSNNNDKCLHTAIVDGTIYLGFFGDDLPGQTRMNSS